MNTTPFYIFLFIHLISLIVGMGAVFVIDFVGLLWVRGRASVEFLLRAADVTQRAIWIGWGGLVVSGIGLITLKGYLDPLTIIKIFLVAMIGVNGIALHFIKGAVGRSVRFQSMPAVYKYHVISTAVVSQVGWWGAIIIGFLHRHWMHYIPWPSGPFPALAIIVGAWLALILIGQFWLARSR